MQFERLELLVGDKIKDIQNTSVLLVGIGGVGGYAFEALVRSGIGKIIIVDFDTIDITNLNRQIIALHENVGKYKVDVAEARSLQINPNVKIIKNKTRLDTNNVYDIFEKEKIDYIVDACDTVSVKMELIRIANKKSIKHIASMGTGNKMKPELFTITDIKKTEYDPLAKVIRKMAKDERIKKVNVVFSPEKPKKMTTKTIASNAFVPATAGLLCASFVINDIVGDINV